MNNEKFDAVVIGQGLAGFSCAMRLQEKGLKVAIVSKSVGATSVSSGSWDFGHSDIYTELLQENASSNSAEENYKSAIATTRFLEPELAFQTAPLSNPVLLPTSSGHWKSALIYQSLHRGAELSTLNGKQIGLLVSKQWRWSGELVGKRLEDEAKRFSASIKLIPIPIGFENSAADLPLSSFATRLRASEQNRKTFCDAISKAIAPLTLDTLIIPPLFLKPSDFTELKNSLNIQIAECLSTSEPVAGYRLYQSINAILSLHKIPVYSVQKLSSSSHQNRIEKLKLDSNIELLASHFILASGKLFGGGIDLGYDQIKETVFDLPVFWTKEFPSIKYRSQLPWQRSHFEEAQAWAKLGVWVDASFRPVDDSKTPLYANLYACGSVIGGVDFAREKVGLGMMASLGRRCADAIS